jgi:hypothetical protein
MPDYPAQTWTGLFGPGGSNDYNSGWGINTPPPPLLPQAAHPAQE